LRLFGAMMPKTKVTLKPSVETLEQRLDSMDRAIILLQDSVNRMPTPSLVMSKVESVEKVAGIQLADFKELVLTMFKGSGTALEAALQAQQKSADKTEVSFTKQFDSLTALINTKTQALDEKIGDNKDRITSSEGRTKGLGDGWVILVGALGVIGVIVGIVGVFIGRT
jgi:hypothetical protein